MDKQSKKPKSRVVKVDSQHTWDFFITQANNQACPVCLFVSLFGSLSLKPCLYTYPSQTGMHIWFAGYGTFYSSLVRAFSGHESFF